MQVNPDRALVIFPIELYRDLLVLTGTGSLFFSFLCCQLRLLSSSSSLTTISTLRLVIGHWGVPLGTSHIWLLRMRTPHSSTNVHLPLLFWNAKIVAVFCLPIARVKALGQVVQSPLRKGAFQLAPLSSLGY